MLAKSWQLCSQCRRLFALRQSGVLVTLDPTNVGRSMRNLLACLLGLLLPAAASTLQAQQAPVATPVSGYWYQMGGAYTIGVLIGAPFDGIIELTDPDADLMTVTVTPPNPNIAGIINQPFSITTPTAGPISLTWDGTADPSNAAGAYDWQIDVFDGTFTTSFIARLDLRHTGEIEVRLVSLGGQPVLHDEAAAGTLRDFKQWDVASGPTGALGLVVVNTGLAGLSLTRPSMGGAWWDEYKLDTSAFDTTLAPGESTSFTVCFDPSRTGYRNAVIWIPHTDVFKPSPFEVPVVGEGVTAPSPISITTPSALPEGWIGRPYGPVALTATGGSGYQFEIISGRLPAGLSLSNAGAITGRPTEVGTFDFNARVSSGSIGNAYASLQVTVSSGAPTASGGAYGEDESGKCSTGARSTRLFWLLPLTAVALMRLRRGNRWREISG